MNPLSPIQIRVLGCLIEKKETTPDQYPLSVNALRLACNQKTARDPVTAYTEGEVGHAVRELEGLGFVQEVWGGRVPRYEHQAGKALDLQSKGLALMCPLMLRGPQTLGELRSNAQRLHPFDDLDDVRYTLQRLAEHSSPLVMELPRQPGHKEIRFAQLLGGKPELPTVQRPPRSWDSEPAAAESGGPTAELVRRIEALESAVAVFRAELEAIRNSTAS